MKKLSALDATLLVMGGIIGVGIFFTPRAVAESVPWAPAFLAMWVIGGLIALCGALTFAELGGTFPKAGGWFVFLREAFGPLPAFLFASVVLCVISTGATAVMVEICVANLHGLVPGVGPSRSASALVVGAVIIVAVTGLVLRGAKTGATFQNVCMAVKLLAILALVVAGLALYAPDSAHVAAAPPPRPDTGSLASGMVAAILPVLFACGGWQHVCYIAPQVENPGRNVPRAIVVGVVGVVVTYLLINAAYVRVLGIEGLATDTQFAGRMAELVLGSSGRRILQAAIAISALGVAIVTIVVSPWLYVAMARESLFFERFGHVSPRTGAPVHGLCVQAVLTLAYWFWGRAEVVVNSVVFVEWIFHALVALALLQMRRTRPDLPRPFASPAYPLAPVLYLLLALAVVLGTLWRADPRDTGIGLGVLVVALLVYAPWRRVVARSATDQPSSK